MLEKLLQYKTTFLLIGVLVIFLVGGYFVYQKVFVKASSVESVQEVDLSFDPEGPYAILTPRRDGKALVVNIKRTGSYDQIKYELVYNSEGVDRGASGDINAKDKKTEYEQEVLFGSCSTGGKCVYDPNVENGTLTLRIKKGNTVYKMPILWHLQSPDQVLGLLTSGDNHFTYKIDKLPSDISLYKYTVINDLTGLPKLPNNKLVYGKVYSLNTPSGRDFPKGTVTIELSENPPANSKIARWNELADKWEELDTKTTENKLSALTLGAGIFAVLSPNE